VSRITILDRRIAEEFSELPAPARLALDPTEENLYVLASDRILRVNLATRIRSLFAGSSDGKPGFAGDGGGIADARFDGLADLAVDRAGNIYVADRGNHRIRRVDANTLRVSTVAGNGTLDVVALGSAVLSGLPSPMSIAVDDDGVLYATSANRVVRIDRGGAMQVIAGSIQGGFSGGDGAFGASTRFNLPFKVRVDGTRLFVTDALNHRIHTLTPVRASRFVLVSGNNQSAPVNSVAANPLVVQVRLPDGTPVPGIPVMFTASAGRFESASSTLTGLDGNASARLAMPPAAGRVTVTATVDGLSQLTFTATAVPAVTVTRPRISSVITAGAFGAAGRIAPGGWVELYGTDFARETRQWSGGDFTGGTAPTSLGNVRVLINERPAYVQRISPGQINAVAPDGIGTGRVAVQVINAEGNSESFLVDAAERAPALLAPPSFASGGTRYVAAMLADGAFAGPENLVAGTAFRPARAGDRLVLYGVGFGATTPAVPAGQIAGTATVLPNLRVTIGGMEAGVEYGGLAGGFVGLYQLNVVVPQLAAPPGPAPLSVTVDGVAVAQTLAVAVAP
jgi:uncharacterized protein (TIGR03437 family)